VEIDWQDVSERCAGARDTMSIQNCEETTAVLLAILQKSDHFKFK
jgi:hypothetical protein